MPWHIYFLIFPICAQGAGDLRRFSFSPKFRKFRYVKASNGTDHFGLVRPEYLGPALKVAHFDRSGYLGRSDRNDPFHVTKLLSPVPTFFYPAYKNNNQTRGGLGGVCATGMYRSIRHVELPKFQTWIFVEWKACLLYQVPVSHCFPARGDRLRSGPFQDKSSGT